MVYYTLQQQLYASDTGGRSEKACWFTIGADLLREVAVCRFHRSEVMEGVDHDDVVPLSAAVALLMPPSSHDGGEWGRYSVVDLEFNSMD